VFTSENGERKVANKAKGHLHQHWKTPSQRIAKFFVNRTHFFLQLGRVVFVALLNFDPLLHQRLSNSRDAYCESSQHSGDRAQSGPPVSTLRSQVHNWHDPVEKSRIGSITLLERNPIPKSIGVKST